jgi:cyclic dehypoxanthinyl futalosine synthase
MWRSATNGNHYGATAEEYLRHIAVARLFLDNILHHQASWSTQEHDVVRQSLHFGIDDFGSATPEANVFGSSGAENGNAISEGQVHQIIREAGYTPARRDTAYNLLYVFENPDESPVSTQATCTSHATQEFKDVIPLHSNLN